MVFITLLRRARTDRKLCAVPMGVSMRCTLCVALSAMLAACGASATQVAAAADEDACRSARPVPAGRWSGGWSSYAHSHPDHVVEGTVELVVSQSGKISGSTTDETNDARGSVEGDVKSDGSFTVKYAVQFHGGGKQSYGLKGTFACERGELHGEARVERPDGEPGSAQLRLHRDD